jgi:hypothetical protein
MQNTPHNEIRTWSVCDVLNSISSDYVEVYLRNIGGKMTHIWHREKATNLHITQHIPYLYSILNSLNDKFLIYQNPFLTTNKLINFADFSYNEGSDFITLVCFLHVHEFLWFLYT